MTKSDHFDGRRFFNPAGIALQSFAAVPRMLREPAIPWPRHVDEPAATPAPLGDALVVVTFIGHSTFLIQTAAGNILTDPMYSERAGPMNRMGPRRVRRPAVAFDDLPPIAMVLLSHNHYDHCDRRTLRRLAERFDPLVVTPLGNRRLVRSAGLRRIEELDWWDEARTPPSRTGTATARNHRPADVPRLGLRRGLLVDVDALLDERVPHGGAPCIAPDRFVEAGEEHQLLEQTQVLLSREVVARA